MLGLNQNSLYVSMGRLKKAYPDLFNLPIHRFLDEADASSMAAQARLWEKQTSRDPAAPIADGLIGERLARALPPAGES
jgi:hypothetical protein